MLPAALSFAGGVRWCRWSRAYMRGPPVALGRRDHRTLRRNAVQRRMCTADPLWAELDAGSRRGPPFRGVLGMVADGVRSAAERAAEAVLAGPGCPSLVERRGVRRRWRSSWASRTAGSTTSRWSGRSSRASGTFSPDHHEYTVRRAARIHGGRSRLIASKPKMISTTGPGVLRPCAALSPGGRPTATDHCGQTRRTWLTPAARGARKATFMRPTPESGFPASRVRRRRPRLNRAAAQEERRGRLRGSPGPPAGRRSTACGPWPGGRA